jgi:hypothetical protein
MMPGIAYTLPYFSGGVIMYVVYQRFGTTPRLAWLSLGFICASALVGFQHYAFAIFGAYIVVFLAERPNIGRALPNAARRVLGVYLFGWPVEKLIQHTRFAAGSFCMQSARGFACAMALWAIEAMSQAQEVERAPLSVGS